MADGDQHILADSVPQQSRSGHCWSPRPPRQPSAPARRGGSCSASVMRQPVMLQLDVEVVAPEQVGAAPRVSERRGLIPAAQRLDNRSVPAAGERDQPFRVLLQYARRQQRLAFRRVVACRRDQRAEVAPAGRVLDQQRQVLRIAVSVLRREREFRAEDRANARRLCRLLELDCAVDRIVIGQRQRGHPQRRRPLDQFLRGRSAVEQAVAGMGVQFDILSHRAAAATTSAPANPDRRSSTVRRS